MKNTELTYQMTKKMFNAILATRTEEEKKLNPYAFVTKVVNEEFGIKGTISRVSFYN